MDEIKRLQELAGIYEIKVNKPISKRELFDYFNNNHLYLLSNLTQYTDQKHLLSQTRYDSLDTFLKDDFGYEDDIPELKGAINNYYGLFKYNEILCETFEKGDNDLDNGGIIYKYFGVSYLGDGDFVLIGHNL